LGWGRKEYGTDVLIGKAGTTFIVRGPLIVLYDERQFILTFTVHRKVGYGRAKHQR